MHVTKFVIEYQSEDSFNLKKSNQVKLLFVEYKIKISIYLNDPLNIFRCAGSLVQCVMSLLPYS